MKQLLFSGLLFMATLGAHAFPKVGSSATFVGVYEGGGGGQMAFEQTLKILAEEKSDNGVVYKLGVMVVVDGQTQNNEELVLGTDLLDTNTVRLVLAHCKENGGQPETVAVPAGSFAACLFQGQDGSKTWIGDIPFGVIKQVSVDEEENKMTLELKAFQR